MSETRERDERMLERVRELYQPEPMSSSQRAAFDAALRAQIETDENRGRWLRVVAPAAAGLMAAIALWLVMSLPRTEPGPGSGPVTATTSPTAESLTQQAWDYAVLLPSELEDWFNGDGEDTEELPEEYLAIASAVFGDHE